MTEFFFNFKDLTNIQNPNKVMLNLTSFIISDDYIKKLFPKRYNFYMKFIDGFSSPTNLYKYLYRTKESKDYYQELQDKLAKVSNSLSKLSKNNKSKVIANLNANLNHHNNNKYDKFINAIKGGTIGPDGENTVIEPGTGTGTGTGPLIEQAAKRPSNPKTDENSEYYIKKTFKPMETFLNDVETIAPILNLKPPKSLDDIVIKKNTHQHNEEEIQTKDLSEKTDELEKLYKNYLNNPLFSPERLEVNIYDRLTFICITYIIRFITLQFIYWCLNSNIINNFSKAFIYYTIIYILFFIFITSIVNVMYFFPIFELFSNISILTVFPNYLYYFYVYTNGYMSLSIHLFIILILLFVPFILTMDRKDDKMNNDDNISYDYKKKNDIYISISNFSLIIWVLTSIISLKF